MPPDLSGNQNSLMPPDLSTKPTQSLMPPDKPTQTLQNTTTQQLIPQFVKGLGEAARRALYPVRYGLNKLDQGQRMMSDLGNAVLGIPRREVEGAIGAHQAGDYGPLKVAQHALYAGYHPGEEQNIQQQAETAEGVSKLKVPEKASFGAGEVLSEAALGALNPAGATAIIQGRMANDPEFVAKLRAIPNRLRNFGIDFTFDMLHDPVNLLFLTDAPAAALARKLAPLGEKVMGAEALQPTMEFTRTLHRVKQETGAPGSRTHTSLENAVENNARVLEQQSNAVIAKHGPTVDRIFQDVNAKREELIKGAEERAEIYRERASKIKDNLNRQKIQDEIDKNLAKRVDGINKTHKELFLSQVPPEVQGYYRGWLYRLGSPMARRQAMAAGFSPSKDLTDVERVWNEQGISPGPLNLVESGKGYKGPQGIGGKPTISYFPQTTLSQAEKAKELLPGQIKRVGNRPTAPYAKFQSEMWPDTLPSERMKADLKSRLIDYRKSAKQHMEVNQFSPKTPDITSTQEAIAREQDPARKATLEKLLAKQNEKLDTQRATHQRLVRPGVQEESLTNQGLGEFKEGISDQQLYEQTLRKMGLVPGKMGPMGIKLPRDISHYTLRQKKVLEQQIRRLETTLTARKSKDYLTTRAISKVQRLAGNLQGKAESAVAGPLGKAERAATNVANQTADIGQRGIDKGDVFNKEPLAGKVSGRVPTYAKQLETSVGKLQAIIRKTGDDQSAAAVAGRDVIRNLLETAPKEAGEKVVKEAKAAAKSLADAEARAKLPEERIAKELEAKRQYHRLLSNVIQRIEEERPKFTDPTMPPSIAQEAFGAKTKLGGFGPGQKISDLMRRAYFLLPARHGYINVPVLNIIADHGFPVAMKGYAIAMGFGDPAEVAYYKRLAEGGGSMAHFTRPAVEERAAQTSTGESATEEVEHPLPFEKQIEQSQQVTQRGDTAQRVARWYYVDHDPKTKDLPFLEKSGIVNDALVDYSHASPVSKLERKIGGNFPQWRNTLVPTIGKAFLRHPEAFNVLFDLENNLNQDIIPQDAGYRINPALPTSEGLGGVINPFGYGESTMRWVMNVLDTAGKPLNQQLSNQQLRQDVMTLLSIAPGGVIPEAGIGMYQSQAEKVPLGTRLASSVLGAHPVITPSDFSKVMQYFEVHDGMDPDEALTAARLYYKQIDRARRQ